MSGRRSDWMAVAGILGGAAVGALATFWLSQPSHDVHVAEVADQVECRVDIVQPKMVFTAKASPNIVIYRGEQSAHDELPALRARIEGQVSGNSTVYQRLHADDESGVSVVRRMNVSRSSDGNVTIARINEDDGHVIVETSVDGEHGNHIVFLSDGDEDHRVVEHEIEVEHNVECAEAVDIDVDVDLDVAEITRQARDRQREQLDRARAEIERAREQVERSREQVERRREDIERVRERMSEVESVRSAEVAARLQASMQGLALEQGELQVRIQNELQEAMRELELKLEAGDLDVQVERQLEDAMRQIQLQLDEEGKRRKRRNPRDGGGF